MRKFLDAPVFLWARGKRERWKLTEPPRAEIIYGSDNWPDLNDADANLYSPLNSDPHAFEAFANVGRLAIELGSAAAKQAGHVAQEGGSLWWQTASRRSSVYGEDHPDVRAAVLKFVRDYGPLVSYDGQHAFGVRSFVIEASDMEEALRIAKAEAPRPPWLTEAMTEHLRGVHPSPAPAPGLGAYGMTCDSLLAALWWQFVMADANDAVWRVCAGCSRTFVQARKNQQYHDRACCNRANVRKSEAKAKAARKEEGEDA